MGFEMILQLFVSVLIFIGLMQNSCKAITFEEDVTLTLAQKGLLDEFKIRVMPKLVEPYMQDDLFLLKWLRYSNFNVESAESRLLKHMAWRKKNGMDTIDQEDFSDLRPDFRYSLEGRDKLGRSFIYFEAGTIDLRRALVQGKGEKLMRYVDKGLQEACTLVRNLGQEYKNITRGHLIINLDGFNIMQHGCLRCIPFLLRIVIGYEENYPECADQIITVNTPSSVEPVLNAIKALLSPGMRKSLHIYGTNRRQWLNELEKDFDFDKLPPSLGGSKIYAGMEDDY
ncbi:SEC14-like protein 2 [Folsomia candida]|uniref:SEC14-like protein 2 n=1 Tax=Folsomia candida TaxID=158441 RepID=UPI000B900ABB|nr:SEC14-like protein 2 [Folsomia candida]